MHNIVQDIAFGLIKQLYPAIYPLYYFELLVSSCSCSSTSNSMKIHLDLTCSTVTINILQPSSLSVLAVLKMNEVKMSRFAPCSVCELPSERFSFFPFLSPSLKKRLR